MKFTRLPSNFDHNIQLNAGIILTNFNPSSPTVSAANILAATSGGVSFTDTPSYVDFGEDIDNCPKNTKELKRVESREIKLSGIFLSITGDIAKKIIGGADVTGSTLKTVTPRDNLTSNDFNTFWWIGDYSDKTGNTNGGFCAIKIVNALSTGGLSIQSGDKSKGQFSVEFTAHYSINDIDTVPYVMYIQEGTDEPTATYTEVTLTNGFETGVTYYTRSGTEGAYVYTKVTSGSAVSGTTYYTKD